MSSSYLGNCRCNMIQMYYYIVLNYMGRLYTCHLRFKFMTKTADYTRRKEEPSFSGTAMPSRWEISETEVRGKIVEVVGKAPFTVLERDYSLGACTGETCFRPVMR